ncbi:hypothetical protein PQR62_13360 [Herbaspirillum lusitanum]|uniref:Uncharacterized protein n=1 Tax=Herbaspirillum lusitanum TaxID=213312 RepID=A0ABW9AAK3_9BURK
MKRHTRLIDLSIDSSGSADQAVIDLQPRVTKLEKHKYAAYVDTHIGPLWSMLLDSPARPVRICKNRKAAMKAALKLLAGVRKQQKQPRV